MRLKMNVLLLLHFYCYLYQSQFISGLKQMIDGTDFDKLLCNYDDNVKEVNRLLSILYWPIPVCLYNKLLLYKIGRVSSFARFGFCTHGLLVENSLNQKMHCFVLKSYSLFSLLASSILLVNIYGLFSTLHYL